MRLSRGFVQRLTTNLRYAIWSDPRDTSYKIYGSITLCHGLPSLFGVALTRDSHPMVQLPIRLNNTIPRSDKSIALHRKKDQFFLFTNFCKYILATKKNISFPKKTVNFTNIFRVINKNVIIIDVCRRQTFVECTHFFHCVRDEWTRHKKMSAHMLIKVVCCFMSLEFLLYPDNILRSLRVYLILRES